MNRQNIYYHSQARDTLFNDYLQVFVSHHYDNLTNEIYKDNCSKLCINMKCNKLEKNKKLIQTQQAS